MCVCVGPLATPGGVECTGREGGSEFLEYTLRDGSVHFG